jgi:V/A-type H+-transporting ATPase subunit D
MSKIKLSTQELKRQKEDLKRYRRFLPTLILKKLQIRIELGKVKSALKKKINDGQDLRDDIRSWIAVLGEEAGIRSILEIDGLETETRNVAGVEVPVLKTVRFKKIDYDLYTTPLWMDKAVETLKALMTIEADLLFLEKQRERLENEMRTTIQRVNLFEKIKIPETMNNIRRIQIFLGDQQTAGVVRGKISKSKLSKRWVMMRS